MINALFLLALSATVLILKPCEPYAVCILFGDIAINPEYNEGLGIYSNTQQACPNSSLYLTRSNILHNYCLVTL